MKGNGSRALLSEMLIVVLFFALCCVVITNVFVKASSCAQKARSITLGTEAAQSAADLWYATGEVPEDVTQDGYVLCTKTERGIRYVDLIVDEETILSLYAGREERQ